MRLAIMRTAALALALAAQLPAQQPDPPLPSRQGVGGTFRVATKESPPFSFRGADGEWTGISIELAREVSQQLGLTMEIEPVDSVEMLLQALAQGRADAAFAAMTVTRDREARVDFSHPYYVTGLGIAVRQADDGAIGSFLRALTSPAFLQLLGAIVVSLLLAGSLFWLAEGRRHPDYRNAPARSGVATGVWWSTIVLFGHKGLYPRTFLGCILAAGGMLTSVLLLSALTGAIASVLTVSRFESSIRDAADLRRMRTVSVPGTSSAEFLSRVRVRFVPVDSARAGLDRVASRQADAMVYDAPILQFFVNEKHPEALRVLERSFEVQDYAVALPLGSPMRKRVNQALHAVRSSPRWPAILFRYLGK